MMAVHCMARGEAPGDYVVLVKPHGALLDPVGSRAGELLNVGRAIRCDVDLTAREGEVLEWVVRSFSNKQIADKLNIAERTVKFHVSALLAKFKVSDRITLIRRCMFAPLTGTEQTAEQPDMNVGPLAFPAVRSSQQLGNSHGNGNGNGHSGNGHSNGHGHRSRPRMPQVAYGTT